jgi:hypothetical protein
VSGSTCVFGSWGIGRTSSVHSPHPWLQALNALSGDESALDLAPYLTLSSKARLRAVAELPENWDGEGSAKPRPSSVANAMARLPEICKVAMLAGSWVPPHISASEDGEITFEWWEGARKLTLYFGDSQMEVICVWGADIEHEMDHRVVAMSADVAPAWAWLYGN